MRKLLCEIRGVFAGKFIKKMKYKARLTFPENPELKDQIFNLSLKFKKKSDQWIFSGRARSKNKAFRLDNGKKIAEK